jgi:hypothetical protein
MYLGGETELILENQFKFKDQMNVDFDVMKKEGVLERH